MSATPLLMSPIYDFCVTLFSAFTAYKACLSAFNTYLSYRAHIGFKRLTLLLNVGFLYNSARFVCMEKRW